MSGDNDGIVGRGFENGAGRTDRPIDGPAGRVVDERIDPVPVDVAGMNDIGLGNGDCRRRCAPRDGASTQAWSHSPT
jgi:hypothetical protein